MNKKKVKAISLFLVFVFAVQFLMLPAMAANDIATISSQRSSAYISSYSVTPEGGNGAGWVKVSFNITSMSSESTICGATSIHIKDYQTGNTVKSYYSSTTPKLMGSGYAYGDSVTWYGATAGKRYYAIVNYKAGYSNAYDTASLTSGSVVA